MQRKKALSRKTPLKATSKKRPKQTIPDLTKKADKEFSRYIRLRDSVYDGEKWVGECITCERKMVILQDGKWRAGANIGHFIGRGTKELRYDEFNCNLQCLTELSNVNMYGNYLRSIKDVIPGDAVLAFDEATGEPTVATVVANTPRESETLYEVTLENGTIFRGTGDHRVFCTDGWHRLDEVLQHPDWYDIVTL